MESVLSDVRLSLRSLRRNPGFAAAALLTLALGIGGTCAVFEVVNDVFLRPLPFVAETELLRLRDSTRSAGGAVSTVNTGGRHFLEIAAQAKLLSGVTAQDGRRVALTGDELPESASLALLSPGSLRVLGVQPMLGRSFTAEEEQAGEDAGVALISAGLWQKRFGSDGSVLARTIEVDGRPLRIVGVMPRGYRFPYDAELWLPRLVSGAPGEDYAVFARLASGATLLQARAELAAIAARMPERDARTTAGYGIEATPLRESLLDEQDRVAVALLIVLAFFLLLACVDVAMLLLARSAARQKEFAIRSALGASRARQMRQLFTESVTLSMLGGALGFALAQVLSPLLASLVPSNLSQQLGMQGAPLDFRVPLFAVLLSLLTALAAGLAPALQASRPDLDAVLKGSAPGAVPRQRRRLLGSFVAGQIALGVILLCGAGMVIENFRLLQRSQVGFEPAQLLTADIALPQRRYPDAPARLRFIEQLQLRLSAAAGFEAAAISSVNPLRGGTWSAPFVVEGAEEMALQGAESVNHRLVTPGFFATMQIPLLRGRDFEPQDREGAPPVAIISARLAAKRWPGQEAIGRRLRVARDGSPLLTVVGVAGDVRDQGDLREAWYLPLAQHLEAGSFDVLNPMIRSGLDAQAVAHTLRAVVAQLDPQLAIHDFASMEQVRAETMARDRLGATTVSLFALLGLLLAAVGTYGVMAYALARRTREIGIRLALGAAPRDVLRLLLGEGFGMALLGLLPGLLLAAALHRVLASRLPELGAASPALFGSVGAVFLCVAGVATLLPARRAMRVDPAEALRAE